MYNKCMTYQIARPPFSKLGKKLEKSCRKAIFNFNLLDGIDCLAIALSGGKDSLTLLYLLHAISGRGVAPIKLFAVHIDGDFSCGAALASSFLSKICDELQIPLIIKKTNSIEQQLDCYSCSRERRKLLFEAAKELNINTIAFGHHRDDAIQTLLLNLLTKGEFEGMLPKLKMQHFGISIIRPLFYIAEKDIKTFAEQYNFIRIVCNCPKGKTSYRHNTELLIQDMEKLFPNVRKNLLTSSLIYGTKKAEKVVERSTNIARN